MMTTSFVPFKVWPSKLTCRLMQALIMVVRTPLSLKLRRNTVKSYLRSPTRTQTPWDALWLPSAAEAMDVPFGWKVVRLGSAGDVAGSPVGRSSDNQVSSRVWLTVATALSGVRMESRSDWACKCAAPVARVATSIRVTFCSHETSFWSQRNCNGEAALNFLARRSGTIRPSPGHMPDLRRPCVLRESSGCGLLRRLTPKLR